MSLGVGENEEKRIDDAFEEAVLRKLLSLNRPVVIDHGAGGAEAERVDNLIQRLDKPSNLIPHNGSFSSFTRQIVTGSMYFGYDSAGQHVAAAAGVPLVSVFCGYASERMFARWKPSGDGVIRDRAGEARQSGYSPGADLRRYLFGGGGGGIVVAGLSSPPGAFLSSRSSVLYLITLSAPNTL